MDNIGFLFIRYRHNSSDFYHIIRDVLSHSLNFHSHRATPGLSLVAFSRAYNNISIIFSFRKNLKKTRDETRGGKCAQRQKYAFEYFHGGKKFFFVAFFVSFFLNHFFALVFPSLHFLISKYFVIFPLIFVANTNCKTSSICKGQKWRKTCAIFVASGSACKLYHL